MPTSEQAARKRKAPKEPVRPHQPGQAAFRAVLAEDIEWPVIPVLARMVYVRILAVMLVPATAISTVSGLG